jgi:hypothetical protein
MQHLDIPAGSGLNRVETLPGEEAQGGPSRPVVAVKAMRVLRLRRMCGM